MTKSRKEHSEEEKRKAADDYVSGRKTADEIAAEIGVDRTYIYKWCVQLDEKAKGARAEEFEAMRHSKAEARKIQAFENEIEEYKKKVAEVTGCF